MPEKEIVKAVLFVNFSDEDFVGKWDGVEYKFKAGESRYMEDWKARHFAKHLVDRELQKMGKLVSDQLRPSLLAKCIIEDEEETIEAEASKITDEILNLEKAKEEVEKKEKEEEVEIKEEEKEEEFIELKEEENEPEPEVKEKSKKGGRPAKKNK